MGTIDSSRQSLSIGRGINGLEIYSMVTVNRFCICESLPTVCQQFLNGLEINLKTNTIFLKLMKFVTIVVAKYLLFDRYSE